MERTVRALIAGMLGLALLSMPALAKDRGIPGRLLTGKVVNRQDAPLPNAVVYVTDSRTHAVKTYIVSDDGLYRFPALAANVDYEVYAQLNGKTSDTKRVSQFDDRKIITVDLKIDTR